MQWHYNKLRGASELAARQQVQHSIGYNWGAAGCAVVKSSATHKRACCTLNTGRGGGGFDAVKEKHVWSAHCASKVASSKPPSCNRKVTDSCPQRGHPSHRCCCCCCCHGACLAGCCFMGAAVFRASQHAPASQQQAQTLLAASSAPLRLLPMQPVPTPSSPPMPLAQSRVPPAQLWRAPRSRRPPPLRLLREQLLRPEQALRAHAPHGQALAQRAG